MKFCYFPGLEMALKITSLQTTKQHDSVLEIKPLNVQNKGIFYILCLLQVPPSNTVLQHRAVTYHLKNCVLYQNFILETCKLLNYSASCKGTLHPQRMFTATDVRNLCQGT